MNIGGAQTSSKFRKSYYFDIDNINISLELYSLDSLTPKKNQKNNIQSLKYEAI